MSYPPGPADPDSGGPRDPWAAPPAEQPTTPRQPAPGYGQPPYAPPQYAQPGYGYPRPTNGKATAALWTGLASIAFAFCCGLGVILGVLPIVLGVRARAEIRATGGVQDGDGMALTGIITGAVAMLLSVAILVTLVIAIANGRADFSSTPGSGV